ncbi:MAG: SDR family oxidoreductase [Ilumatobacteraceae bacterium]
MNAICPGLVMTDMVYEKAGKALGVGGIEDSLPTTPPSTALGCCVTVEELAAMAVLLASDDGAGITGQSISVDGGAAFY